MIQRKKIEEAVTQIVADHLKMSPLAVEKSTEFDSYRADSLDFVEILMAVEEHYSLDIPTEAASYLKTVTAYTDLIEQQLRKRH